MMIRKIGFVLLLGGFLWLLVDCVLLAPVVQQSRLDKKVEALKELSLTSQSAASALQSMSTEHRKHLSRLMIPATFMLLGGLTLSVAPRRKKEPKPGLAPPGPI